MLRIHLEQILQAADVVVFGQNVLQILRAGKPAGGHIDEGLHRDARGKQSGAKEALKAGAAGAAGVAHGGNAVGDFIDLGRDGTEVVVPGIVGMVVDQAGKHVIACTVNGFLHVLRVDSLLRDRHDPAVSDQHVVSAVDALGGVDHMTVFQPKIIFANGFFHFHASKAPFFPMKSDCRTRRGSPKCR